MESATILMPQKLKGHIALGLSVRSSILNLTKGFEVS